ncbi:LptE family protein [Larkinella sp. VNQ87]|uniref:LptE family protein n=1 Tax=Larkinella sp. VNQ87 TaxID=3400921 RepID=UPI003BFEDDA8
MKKIERVKNYELRRGRPAVMSYRFRIWSLFLILNSSLLPLSCGKYSFTGTTLDPTIKTITVNTFTTSAAGGPANLPIQFTEKLKEYYQRYTDLKVVPSNGDIILEGSISGYDVLPVAATASDQAAQNRLQVTAQVRFSNTKDESKNFDQPFSFYQDFPANQTLSQNESRLLPKIQDQLVLDIFNKTAADW